MAKWMDTLELIEGPYYEVETNDNGTCVVPEEVCGRAPGVSAKRRREQLPDSVSWDRKDEPKEFGRVWDHLSMYVDGRDPYRIERKRGVCWRLTQPGYMDCTEWCSSDSEEEAREQAKELYDHGEEE